MIAGVTEAGRGPVRALRALFATLLTVALAAAGHALGGGVVAGGAVAVLVLLVLPLAVLTTRARWTAPRALAALAAGQLLVHLLLSWMSPAAGGTAQSAHRGHPLTDLALLAQGGPAGSGAHVHVSGALTISASGRPAQSAAAMLLAHALMVVVTAVLLARGEALVWAVVARLLPTPTRPRAPRPVARPAILAVVRQLRSRRWTGPLPGRGPPLAQPV